MSKLVEKYVSLFNKPIPSNSASVQDKRKWLLTEEWGCHPPGTTEFKDREYCKKHNDSSDTTQHISERPAMLNKLKQEGFIHWLNTITYQCIHKITGETFDMDTSKGVVKQHRCSDRHFPDLDLAALGLCLACSNHGDDSGRRRQGRRKGQL